MTEQRISRRIAAIAESATLKVDAKAKALQAEGRPVISYAAGEPDFPTPDHVIEAAHQAALAGSTGYPPTQGLPALRAAVAAAAPSAAPSNVIISTGAKQVISNAFLATLDPGDEVIVFDPAYDSYEPAVRLAGGTCIHLPLTAPDYTIDFDRLAAALSARTRLVVINSPHNPHRRGALGRRPGSPGRTSARFRLLSPVRRSV